MSDHLRLDLDLVEALSVVNTHNGPNHLRDDNHVSQVSSNGLWLLSGGRFLLGLVELLDEGVSLALETALEPGRFAAARGRNGLARRTPCWASFDYSFSRARRSRRTSRADALTLSLSHTRSLAARALSRSRASSLPSPRGVVRVTYFLLGLAQKRSTSSFLFMSRSCSRSMPLNVNFLNVLLFGASDIFLFLVSGSLFPRWVSSLLLSPRLRSTVWELLLALFRPGSTHPTPVEKPC